MQSKHAHLLLYFTIRYTFYSNNFNASGVTILINKHLLLQAFMICKQDDG